jgi:hypothetical protein
LSEAELQFLLENLRSEQNLVGGIAGGLIAALLGASIWAVITVVSEYQIGWMAIGIGFLVGFSVRIAGKGIDQIFGVIGAVMSLVGCAVGNLLTMTYFVAVNENIPYIDLLSSMNLDMAIEIMTITFDPMDILFYGIALYFGYRYAFRQVTAETLGQLHSGAG